MHFCFLHNSMCLFSILTLSLRNRDVISHENERDDIRTIQCVQTGRAYYLILGCSRAVEPITMEIFIKQLFIFCCTATFLDFASRQNDCLLHRPCLEVEKKNKEAALELGMNTCGAVLAQFWRRKADSPCFMLCGAVS